jgi:hypothetical protein
VEGQRGAQGGIALPQASDDLCHPADIQGDEGILFVDC